MTLFNNNCQSVLSLVALPRTCKQKAVASCAVLIYHMFSPPILLLSTFPSTVVFSSESCPLMKCLKYSSICNHSSSQWEFRLDLMLSSFIWLFSAVHCICIIYVMLFSNTTFWMNRFSHIPINVLYFLAFICIHNIQEYHRTGNLGNTYQTTHSYT